jgi:hypothetical protein
VIALVVAGVLVLLAGLGIAVLGYAFSQTDEGKAAMAAITVAAKSGQGPGPDALRAAGCKEAAAVRFDEMNAAARPLLADAGPGSDTVFGKGLDAICMDPIKAITCEDVARIFAQAEKPTTEFTAYVRANGQDRCRITVNPDGSKK